MGNIVYEVFISILILALIGGSFLIFKKSNETSLLVLNNQPIVKELVDKSFNGTNAADGNGGDVIGFIRYFKNDASVQIQVVLKSSSSKTYQAMDYNSALFDIPYESSFNFNYVYTSEGVLTKINCVEK